MKILLITLYGNYNVGNRLQHYALQTVLEKHGEVFSLCYENVLISKIKSIGRICLDLIGVKRYKNYTKEYLRHKTFDYFNSNFIHNKIYVSMEGAFKKNWEKYDYAVCGSDQIFHNWHLNSHELDYFYLNLIQVSKPHQPENVVQCQ